MPEHRRAIFVLGGPVLMYPSTVEGVFVLGGPVLMCPSTEEPVFVLGGPILMCPSTEEPVFVLGGPNRRDSETVRPTEPAGERRLLTQALPLGEGLGEGNMEATSEAIAMCDSACCRGVWGEGNVGGRPGSAINAKTSLNGWFSSACRLHVQFIEPF